MNLDGKINGKGAYFLVETIKVKLWDNKLDLNSELYN